MRRWILTALIAFLAVTPLTACISQHTEGLQDYWAPAPMDEGSTYDSKTRIFTCPNASFEVKLPGAPVNDRHYAILTTNAKKRVQYETPEISYVIATAHIPIDEAFDPKMVKRLKDSEILLMKSDVRANSEVSTYPVELENGKYFGQHSEGTTRDGAYYRLRNYLDKEQKRDYRLIVNGSKESVNSPESNEFFNTFKITP